METSTQIIQSDTILLLAVAGFVLLTLMIPLFFKVRDRRIVKAVTSFKRGTRSERDLILRLTKRGIPAETIFHDLCVVKRNGQFSQIDLALATTEGVIVIEVKDFSGWIYGNGNYTHWTKVLAYGKKKYRFYNPIKQNQGHINALRKQSRQFANIPFFSIIVFYGDCELKEVNYVPKDTYLVKPHRIIEVLKVIRSNNPAAPYTDKHEVLSVLQHCVKNGESIHTQKRHIENIKDMVGKHRIFD